MSYQTKVRQRLGSQCNIVKSTKVESIECDSLTVELYIFRDELLKVEFLVEKPSTPFTYEY